jgi:transposase-like protein
MFKPPRCANVECLAHREPDGRFFRFKGYYRPKCRAVRVPRFVCRKCGKGFSRQTFRPDYRDHRPDLNAAVLSRWVSGTGIRQIGRELRITKRNLELKLRKIGRHLRDLHHNVMATFPAGASFAFDELETFEGCRSTRPVTVPVLIEQESTFIVDARSAPIPPSGRMTPKRRKLIAEEQARHGKRPNRSREVCAEVLATAAARCRDVRSVHVRSDQKKTYPKLLEAAFGASRLKHLQVSSKRKRDFTNPLHRINLTMARLRDLMGRLHRRSWLVTKRREYLDLHLMAFVCYRNYHCARFNDEEESPAQRLGFMPRRLSKGELLSWRQDWGPERSPHPLSPWLESVAEFQARTRREGP